ncbi:MAG: tRNA (guanosine(37)-N1)-methyltransferase TrmD [Rhodospirillaceae bacterium]|jgi:tRNA (guanine37-N1)-methyltransferase|nr:tRNA (guanosine(37)-N1)-methyltransferase TrmD [Rhodospirillaceae bacterium]
MSGWSARVLTIFPDMFPGPLGQSLAGRALDEHRWSLDTVDIRQFAIDKHHTVDDAPFGGGPGMVMRADVLDAAIATVEDEPGPLVYLSPRGRPFDQDTAARFAAGPGMTLICGRFEGIDERVIEARAAGPNPIEEVSVGDFVLSGGEPAALVVLDACVRLLDGVMGTAESLSEESFSHHLLEYPHYTRPAIWRDRAAPDILLSGHHENIRAWRHAQAERITRERRPDLWARYKQDIKEVRT